MALHGKILGVELLISSRLLAYHPGGSTDPSHYRPFIRAKRCHLNEGLTRVDVTSCHTDLSMDSFVAFTTLAKHPAIYKPRHHHSTSFILQLINMVSTKRDPYSQHLSRRLYSQTLDKYY